MNTNGQVKHLDAIDELILKNLPQGSGDWIDARLGRFTASEIHNLIGASDNITQSGMTYIFDKAAEVLTGQRKAESFSLATQYGKEMEAEAREYFEKKMGVRVDLTGFHVYEDHAGGSPDGLVLSTHIIEIKCPYNTTNHLRHSLIDSNNHFEKNHKDYYWQCQANMLFTGRDRCYFISYDPRMKDEAKKMFIYELTADVVDQEKLKSQINKAAEIKLQILNK